MFALTCAKANGTHLGTCIDRFYFGSCCKIDGEPDVFPQDNTIDIDNPHLLSKPYVSSTTVYTLESNDIPGNIDKPNLSMKHTEVISAITRTTEMTTLKSIEQLKTKPSKISMKKTTTPESTTESIKLSTFQTIQNVSDQQPPALSNNAVISAIQQSQKPIIPYSKPVTIGLRPTPISIISLPKSTLITYPHTSKIPTPTSSFSSSFSPLPTSVFGHINVTDKKPTLTSVFTKNPVSTTQITVKPQSNDIIKPTSSYNVSSISVPTTHKTPLIELSNLNATISTTQRTPIVTRFPPRNSTTENFTFSTEISNQLILTTMSENAEVVSRPLTVSKPSTTKKPLKDTTKKPSIISKIPTLSAISRKPPTMITNVTNAFTNPVTVTSPSIFNSSKVATHTSISATNAYTTPGNHSTTISMKKPLISTTTMRITTTIKRPTIAILKKNVTNTVLIRPSTTTSSNITSTTRKPIAQTLSLLSTVIKGKPSISIATAKPTTFGTSDHPKTTKKPDKYNMTATSMIITSVTTEASTTPLITMIQPMTAPNSTSEVSTNSVVQSNIGIGSPSFTVNRISTTSPLSDTSTATTVLNENDTEFDNEMNHTTISPGIITWSSFPNKVESSTQTVEYSSIIPGNSKNNLF